MVSYPAALPRNRESLERLRVQGSALGYDTIHSPSGATVQFKTKISPAFRLAVEYYSPAMAGFAPCIALKILRSNILRGDRLGFLGRQESYDSERRTSFYSNRSRC